MRGEEGVWQSDLRAWMGRMGSGTKETDDTMILISNLNLTTSPLNHRT